MLAQESRCLQLINHNKGPFGALYTLGGEMKELDAVNMILPKLGERPVTSITVPHPTVAIILPILERVRKELNMQGWWYNSYDWEFTPGPYGKIAVGTDVMRLTPLGTQDIIAKRDQYLYNVSKQTEVFDKPVKAWVVTDLDFIDMPETASHYVSLQTLVETSATDIGVNDDLEAWREMAARAYRELSSEHTRQRQFSTKQQRIWRQITRHLSNI